MEDTPAAFVARVESRGSRTVTPVGGGRMVWRGWGAGPPLVLLHGASGSWTHWIRNVLALGSAYRVLVPDMPGFGDSDAIPEPHTGPGLADLVTAGIDLMVPPPGPIDLAGFSLGGIIAGLVAARLGSRVRRLLLLGPGGLGIGPAPRRALLRIDRGMTPEEVRRVYRENLRLLMLGDPASADELTVSLSIGNARQARFKPGTIPESDLLLRALPAIDARIAGVWGARDAFVG
ncbi:MAG TPA: alpha/beta fold hydrolase, partial [Candidatus Bathyarchaeia archaeon]|nr:alpha/beta fold hydrolase [Candidatus Bathyarchaeia archaeon]